MKVRMTRDSVCAGDDLDSPHLHEIAVPEGSSVEQIIETIAKSKYLVSISEGKATWSVASGIPVAVIAQQWHKPKMLCSFPYRLVDLDFADGVLKCHINYHAQMEPGIVFEVLSRLSRLRIYEISDI
jgi:hypothetical protein